MLVKRKNKLVAARSLHRNFKRYRRGRAYCTDSNSLAKALMGNKKIGRSIINAFSEYSKSAVENMEKLLELYGVPESMLGREEFEAAAIGERNKKWDDTVVQMGTPESKGEVPEKNIHWGLWERISEGYPLIMIHRTNLKIKNDE